MSERESDCRDTYLTAKVSHRDFTKVSRLSFLLSTAAVIIMVAFSITILIGGSFSFQGGTGEYILTTRPVPVRVKPWVWYSSFITWMMAIPSIGIVIITAGYLLWWRACRFTSFRNGVYYERANNILRAIGLGLIVVSIVASVLFDAEIDQVILQ